MEGFTCGGSVVERVRDFMGKRQDNYNPPGIFARITSSFVKTVQGNNHLSARTYNFPLAQFSDRIV